MSVSKIFQYEITRTPLPAFCSPLKVGGGGTSLFSETRGLLDKDV